MKKYLFVFVLVLLAVTSSVLVLAQDMDVDEKIENAMSAGPLHVAEEATILDWVVDDEGNLVVLREGTNGWSCLPGLPPDAPMCLDEVFVEWLYALMAGEELTVTKPGFSYHLLGGVALSNSDPAAMEPAEDYWSSTAPYMMVIFPAEVDLSDFSTDPNDPLFVMFPDTPYQHIMVPIGEIED